MQMVIDVFAQIFRTLWAHKLRSFLTMFGIAWGVGSLLLLVKASERATSVPLRSTAKTS
jgi:putative ABC transport system permease protein